jgi:hypothetical protein
LRKAAVYICRCIFKPAACMHCVHILTRFAHLGP